MYYRKEIECTSTGMVIASVYGVDEEGRALRILGNEYFNMFSQESRFKRAHKWADNHIELCKKYEQNV